MWVLVKMISYGILKYEIASIIRHVKLINIWKWDEILSEILGWDNMMRY